MDNFATEFKWNLNEHIAIENVKLKKKNGGISLCTMTTTKILTMEKASLEVGKFFKNIEQPSTEETEEPLKKRNIYLM